MADSIFPPGVLQALFPGATVAPDEGLLPPGALGRAPVPGFASDPYLDGSGHNLPAAPVGILQPYIDGTANAMPAAPIPARYDPGWTAPDLTPWDGPYLSSQGITNGRMLMITPSGQDAFGNPLGPAETLPGSGPTPATSQAGSNIPAAAGQYYLPGVGPTYLDPQFADRIGAFLTNLQNQNISPQFLSGYRDPAKQASLKTDPTAVTPADHSLHSSGHAVDINLGQMDPATQASVVAAAGHAGIGWGGNFRQPDPNHFYFDPGGNRQQQINNFSAGLQALNSRIPDR